MSMMGSMKLILSITSGLASMVPDAMLPILTFLYVIGVIVGMIGSLSLIIAFFDSTLAIVTGVFAGLGVLVLLIVILAWRRHRNGSKARAFSIITPPKTSSSDEVSELSSDPLPLELQTTRPRVNTSPPPARNAVHFAEEEKKKKNKKQNKQKKRARLLFFKAETGLGLASMMLIALVLLGGLYSDWALAAVTGNWRGYVDSFDVGEETGEDQGKGPIIALWFVYFLGQKLLAIAGDWRTIDSQVGGF